MLLSPCAFAQTGPPPPYKTMLDDPLEYAGPDSQAAKPSALAEIRIGLFAPDEGDALGASLVRGVSLAVEQANGQGGLEDIPFRLVRRWAENPWAAGSQEMIRLVYEDRVWAVIGSADSESTHVAQQIITKARVPLLSPVASDSTLTYVRVPWIFRLPPSDATQALCLVREGLLSQGHTRIGLVTSTRHDSRTRAHELTRCLRENGRPPLFHLELPAATGEGDEVPERIRSFQPQALVVHLPPEELRPFLARLEREGFDLPLFLPWIPAVELDDLTAVYNGKVTMVLPFDPAKSDRYAVFSSQYERRFGEKPDAAAAYAYDAASLVIYGLRRSGPSRKGLQEYLNGFGVFAGVTGTIRWDNGGGNTTPPVLQTAVTGDM